MITWFIIAHNAPIYIQKVSSHPAYCPRQWFSQHLKVARPFLLGQTVQLNAMWGVGVVWKWDGGGVGGLL